MSRAVLRRGGVEYRACVRVGGGGLGTTLEVACLLECANKVGVVEIH